MAWQDVDSLNWKVLVAEIVTTFFDASRSQTEKLHKAWSARNLPEVAKAAHALKASCGNVGAQEASQILDQVEIASSKNEIETVQALMEKFPPIFAESCIQISEFAVKLQAA